MEFTMIQTQSAKKINDKDLIKEGYRRCASTIPGGKAWFYYRRDEKTGTHYWVVWNRVERIWVWEYR